MMMELLDQGVIAIRIWLQKGKEKAGEQWEQFKNDEMGVSSIVATIILILIVVILAALFFNSIKEWLGNLWRAITTKGSDIQNQDTAGGL